MSIMPAGAVVVMPALAVEAFWTSMGLPPGGPTVPGKADFTVEPGALPPGADAVPIEAGRFSSGVSGDGALLCLADVLQQDEQGPPYHVSGCARLPGGPLAEVRLSTGFGGVRAAPT